MNKRLASVIMPGRDFKSKLLFQLWKFTILIALFPLNCWLICTKINLRFKIYFHLLKCYFLFHFFCNRLCFSFLIVLFMEHMIKIFEKLWNFSQTLFLPLQHGIPTYIWFLRQIKIISPIYLSRIFFMTSEEIFSNSKYIYFVLKS